MKNMTILVKHKCIHIIRHYGKNSFKGNFKKINMKSQLFLNNYSLIYVVICN